MKISQAEVEALKEKCEKYVGFIYLFVVLFRYSEVSIHYFFED
jgi:hypothetical protein